MDVQSQDRQRMARAFDRYTEFPMLCLALLFIPVLVVPWLLELPSEWETALQVVDGMIWAAFALELVAKAYLAPARLVYLRQHWFDVVVVTVPFLRPLRIVRSTRILRVMRAARVGALAARSAHSLRAVLAEHGLHYVLAASVLLMVVAAGAVTVVERDNGGNIRNFGDALWWSVTTVTTVGYGDRFPVTPEGRAIAAFLMLLGISLFSFVTANIAAFLSKQTQGNDPDLRDLVAQLDRIEQLIRASSSLGGQSRS